MKRMLFPADRRRTAFTTSTTGPHVRLVQNFGVASTNGLCAASDPATEYRRSALSGGLAVVNAAKLPCVLAIVGVGEAVAFDPTAGASGLSLTIRFAMPWIGVPPTGSASMKYLPARGTRTCATYSRVTSPAAGPDSPGTPIGSETAVASANGRELSEAATYTRACGRYTGCPLCRMTRNETRRKPVA